MSRTGSQITSTCSTMAVPFPRRGPPTCTLARRRSGAAPRLLQAEPDLQRHLGVGDASLLDVAADGDDLEPVDVAQALRRLGDRPVDGVVDAGGRRSRDLDGLVDVIGHAGILTRRRAPWRAG